jgi:hypothetical protein
MTPPRERAGAHREDALALDAAPDAAELVGGVRCPVSGVRGREATTPASSAPVELPTRRSATTVAANPSRSADQLARGEWTAVNPRRRAIPASRVKAACCSLIGTPVR